MDEFDVNAFRVIVVQILDLATGDKPSFHQQGLGRAVGGIGRREQLGRLAGRFGRCQQTKGDALALVQR